MANEPSATVMDVPTLSCASHSGLKIHAYEIGRRPRCILGKSDIKLKRPQSARAAVQPSGLQRKENENNGPLSAEDHSGDSRVKSDTLSGTVTSTLTKNLVNEFRFQLARAKNWAR